MPLLTDENGGRLREGDEIAMHLKSSEGDWVERWVVSEAKDGKIVLRPLIRSGEIDALRDRAVQCWIEEL